MSDAAQEPAKKKGQKASPAADAGFGSKHGLPPRGGAAAKAKATHVSVPEVPGAVAVVSSGSGRGSAWRFGLVMATLSIFAGSLTWYVESLAPPSPESVAITSATTASTASTIPPWADPLPPHVRQSIDHELRLAALALDLKDSQENLSRLLEESRSLNATIGDLASGMQDLRAKVGETRTDAVAGLARVEERLHEVELTAGGSVSEASLLAQRDSELTSRLQRLETQRAAVEASTAASPSITGALPETSPVPDVSAAPQVNAGPKATVKVSFTKARARSPKPIPGFQVHSVSEDLARVETSGTLYEVRAGELLPGAGVVRSIKNQGQGWVVVTSRGVIKEVR